MACIEVKHMHTDRRTYVCIYVCTYACMYNVRICSHVPVDVRMSVMNFSLQSCMYIGFIPNSVIRDKLGIKFDPGQFAVEVSSLELSFALQSLLQHKPQKDQNKVKSDMGCRSLSVQSTAIPVSAQSSTLEIALTEEDSTLSSAGGASKESTTWNDSQEDGSCTPGATGNLTQDKKQNASKGTHTCTWLASVSNFSVIADHKIIKCILYVCAYVCITVC